MLRFLTRLFRRLPVCVIFGREIELECFTGFVTLLDRETGTAHVTLTSRLTGDVLHGMYPLAEVEKEGIAERSPFLCTTVKRGDYTTARIEKLPRRSLSEQEVGEIRNQVREQLGDYEPGDDY